MVEKPALIFGLTWYQEFEGIIKYHNGLTLKDILDIKIDRDRVERDYNNLILKTANGIVDRGYIANFPQYSDENNSKHLKESLRKIIKAIS
jgi:hypothetical protein